VKRKKNRFNATIQTETTAHKKQLNNRRFFAEKCKNLQDLFIVFAPLTYESGIFYLLAAKQQTISKKPPCKGGCPRALDIYIKINAKHRAFSRFAILIINI
jgi:hypothetical protein